MIEIQGNYKCARGGAGVLVALPRPEQTEAQFVTEIHTTAESVRHVCNQGYFKSCPRYCQVEKLIEKTQDIAIPHQH